MKLRHKLLAIGLATASLSANADFHAVGPANIPAPPGHGFPLWYQDESGTVLDLCLPNASDPGALQQTACLLTGIGINPPYVFPTSFPDEAFYFRAVSTPVDMTDGKRAVIVLALEAAFGTGSPAVNQQMVFTRIRVTAGVPENGDYAVTHPYGVETFNNVTATPLGNRDIAFTEDVGLTAGDFTGALTSRVGPFLSAADASGGNPKPPVTLNGAQFLSDGVATEFLTGSPFGTNYVLICGKRSNGSDIILGDALADGSGNGVGGTCARTDLFSLTGRLHDNVASPIPSPFKFLSLTYDRDPVNGTHMDGYVSVGKQLPTSPSPLITLAGTNLPPVKMAGPDALKRYYAQDVVVPNGDQPNAVFAINSADAPPSKIQDKAHDVVTILSANYNPGTNTMIVDATTSDKGFGTSPPPNLNLLGYPEITGVTIIDAPDTDPADVRFTVTPALLGTDLPPDTVTVQSEVGGSGSLKLSKGLDAAKFSAPGVPFAQDDVISVEASSPAVTIAVTANDITNPLGNITPNSLLLVPPAPAIGTATVNGNSINFTPSAATGQATVQYTVANSVGKSNTATLTVDVTAPPGGPVPIANPDGVTPVINVNVNQAVTINVLANDSGNGGTLEPATVAITGVTGGTAVANATTGVVTYTAGATAGAFGFDYTVNNTVATGGKVSLSAHVTVTVVAPEQITFAAGAVTCRTGNREWIINGTSTVLTNNTITAYATATVPASPTAAQTIGSAPVGVGGAFQIRVRPGPTCVSPISFKSSLNTQRNNVAVNIRQ